MNSTLGKRLRAARQNKSHYSQQELCDEVNRRLNRAGEGEKLTQATLSAWETGRQSPSEASLIYIETIFELLKLDKTELEALMRQEAEVPLRPDNLYVNQVKEWLETVPSDPGQVKVWFIAPNNFPAFSSHEIFELWVHNLKQGIEYNLLIIVNWLTDPNSFQQLATLLEGLSRRLGDSPWSVNLYVYHSESIPSKGNAEEFLLDFQEIQTMAAKLNQGRSVQAVRIQKPPPEDLWLSIARATPDFGRLVVFLPPFFEAPAASLLLTSTSSTFNSGETPFYRWLNRDACREMRRIVRSVTQHWIG